MSSGPPPAPPPHPLGSPLLVLPRRRKTPCPVGPRPPRPTPRPSRCLPVASSKRQRTSLQRGPLPHQSQEEETLFQPPALLSCWGSTQAVPRLWTKSPESSIRMTADISADQSCKTRMENQERNMEDDYRKREVKKWQRHKHLLVKEWLGAGLEAHKS